jgi:hypothetical protein
LSRILDIDGNIQERLATDRLASSFAGTAAGRGSTVADLCERLPTARQMLGARFGEPLKREKYDLIRDVILAALPETGGTDGMLFTDPALSRRPGNSRVGARLRLQEVWRRSPLRPG